MPAEATLSTEELARARRFHFEKDRTNYLLAHGLTRLALAKAGNCAARDIAFDIEPHVCAARFQTRHQSFPNPFPLAVAVADKKFSAHSVADSKIVFVGFGFKLLFGKFLPEFQYILIGL